MLSKLQSTPSIDSFYEVFFGSCFTFLLLLFLIHLWPYPLQELPMIAKISFLPFSSFSFFRKLIIDISLVR